MRALNFGALAIISTLALAGCSRPDMPQVAAPCVDLSGRACANSPPDGQPTQLAPATAQHGGRSDAVHRATLRRKRAHAAAKRRAHKVVAMPVARPKKLERPDPPSPTGRVAAPVSATTPSQAPTPTAPAEARPDPGKVQTEVTVAAQLAERMTALRVPAIGDGEAKPDDRLVAVLLTRPGTRISDLSGKVVAIDERYAKSNARITAAMSAAGASEVLILEGQATAITRLTNGEVAGAIVALASPEAAEACPKIAGFQVLQVALPKP